MKQTAESSGKIPPYGATTRLKKVFDILSSSSLPQITSATLRNLKFSGSDAALTASALRFLGIVDNEGNKTDKMSLLQLKGEDRKNALNTIVLNAYSIIFESTKEANKLNRESLHNIFLTLYHLSGRQAQSAVPNFLWLCQEAGMETTESFEVKSRNINAKVKINNTVSMKTNKTSEEQKEAPLSSLDPVELGEFKLILPGGWDVIKTRKAIASGDFGDVYKKLTAMSESMKKSV